MVSAAASTLAAAVAKPAGPRAAPSVPGYALGQLLHSTASRAVYAALRLADRHPVVIKTLAAQYPTRPQVATLRREFQIMQRLQSLPVVARVHALEPCGNGNLALVLEPFGTSLAGWLASRDTESPGAATPPVLALAQFLGLARALAEALAQLHEQGIVHKNIAPGSILVDDALAVRLIDFSHASELALESQNNALARQIEGALPYISPEQTGRMNRELDYRSDYYSLGVTLYRLLVGRLPFEADSVLGWVHAHISRQPPSPRAADSKIAPAVAAIVLKLLAKNPEDRYQSSFGLIEDLDRCSREWAQGGVISEFTLGHRDVPRQFQVSQRLYGRQAERAALLAAFERVAAGAAEVCMVSGRSGIGKSALVGELAQPLARRGGWMVQGKFDQFQRSTPYATLAAALRSLVAQMLADQAGDAAPLRRRLESAVGSNGRLLVDLVPELESLLGSQPPAPELPRNEAQNRFQITLLDFVRAVAAEQPLVIFFDDMQFSDASTLLLLRWLADARDLRHLLVIGAYRSNEVDAGHPLRLALAEIEEAHAVLTLALRPLGADAVEQLVADTLHTDRASAAPLAALLHDKVQGNPYFLSEMLKTLEQQGAIRFAAAQGRWRWDIEAVRRSALADNVVDFVVANLRRLPPATQRALQFAACIGSTFDLRTLALIQERGVQETGRELLPSLQRHLVIPLHDDYKLVGGAAGCEDEDIDPATAFNPSYRFQHDRVQQAAYALIDADRRQAVHLSVGRLMQRHENARERLIDIVGHLDEGRRLITDPAERLALARLNLEAGVRAQRSSAYESALSYLRIGQELLPPQAWECEYELTLALATEVQQCAYLTARYDEAEALIETMLARARSRLQKAEMLAMRTRQHATTGKMAASIQAAIQGLSLLGLRITDHPDRAAIRRETADVSRNLAGRRIAELIDAPPLRDPEAMVAIRLLMEIFPAAFLSGSGRLFPFLVLKSVNISLRGGNSPESAFAYAAYGMLLCGALDDPAQGCEFGQLAVAMNDRFDDIGLKSRVIYLYTMFVHHWSHHWSSMTPWFRRGIESGYRSGDLLYLAYSAQDCIIWDPGLDLETAEREHAEYLKIVRNCKYQDSYDSGTLFLQMQRNFLGRTEGLCSMNDASFDEQHCVAGMRERGFMTGIANYHIYKAEICWLHGQPEQAMTHVEEQDRLIASVMSLPQLVRFHIVSFLARGAQLPELGTGERAAVLRRLRADARRMARWAANCEANFLHLARLMQAELARIAGREQAALRLYEQAIAAAREHGFVRDEAMANERAGRHLWAAGRPKAAEGYLRAAWHLYDRWGARRKVELLAQEFEHLADARAGGVAPAAGALDSAALDMSSVMKASQAISGEIVLEQLWASTMRIMLENAGGQRGCFVLERDREFFVEGLIEVGDAASPPAGASGPADAVTLPMSIVYQVLNMHTAVVIDDATRLGLQARDAYLQAHRPQSLLCVPLVRQGRFEGAIYMENRLAAGVFTHERIEVIKLLAAQASISIENAHLYADQRRLIEAQRRFVPREFLESLDRPDITGVDLGENVAKTMSVMFADLRGFTPLAEKLDARTVIGLLNRYFAAMEEPIAAAGGFIDSFAGDEIKVLFDVGPDAALQAAVGMWRALEALNAHSAAIGQPELRMGLGINTGPVVLGTVGGPKRIQCSVIGDTVNTASRVEQLTKVYHARVLVGEPTWRGLAAPQAVQARRVDRVAVKGRDTALDLYELLDAETPERRAAKLATRDILAAAMDGYQRRDFASALALFGQAAALDPLDAVPPLFIERARRRLTDPPPADWPGWDRLTEK